MNRRFWRIAAVTAGLATALMLGVPHAASGSSRGGTRGTSRGTAAGGAGHPKSTRTTHHDHGDRDVDRVVVAPYYANDLYWGPGWAFGVGWGWGWPYYGAYGAPYYPPRYGYMQIIPRHSAAVDFHVHPWNATVTIDGHAYGRARDFNDSYDPLWLGAGEHHLELSYPGYMTLGVPLDVSSGGRYSLHYRLEEGEGVDPRSVAPDHSATPTASGRIDIEVQPPDAAVYLDGSFLGRADQLEQGRGSLRVQPGNHSVEAVRPGFRSRSVAVNVRADRPARVEIELRPNHAG
jgi:hypothetical protein